MKTIKSKIMGLFEEIRKDNSNSFGSRKYLREYLGSVVINYRRKSDKKLVMKIYKSKNGAEIYIDNAVYFYKVIDGIAIIYNEYGKAVSITYTDGYEWTGETFISEEAVVEENNFRIKYQNFIKNVKTSRNLNKMYDDCIEMLNLLDNTTCIGDTTKIYNNLNAIRNYFLHNSVDDYFDDALNNIKNINNSLENYCKKENEIDNALKTLKDYYNWVLYLENFNANKLNPNDEFFKLINEMKKHINKLFKKITISQNDWDLLEYYHDEIEKMLADNEKITTNFSSKNRNADVKLEFIDLNDEQENIETKKEKTINKFFKRATLDEKADYLTFKTLRKYGTDNKELDVDSISVKNTKKELKNLNKTVNKYEKLINKDQNKEIDNISYATYNIVKNARNNLENSGILEEKTTNEVFVNTLKNNYDRSVYLKRQEELNASFSKISKIKNIIGNMSDESFLKIKNNYRKLKRKAIGLGTGIFAGILAVTSFGAGAYKNHQNNLKNNSLIYENDSISIYGSEDQVVELNNNKVIFEDYLEGLGSQNILNINEEKSLDKSIVGLNANIEVETIQTENETELETEAAEIETNQIESETELETEAVEILTEANTENDQKVTVVEDDIAVLSVENLSNETADLNDQIEIVDENNNLENLATIEDEKDLLNTYKNELQNIQTFLPQSDIKLDNVRNIGDVVNITSDANLQNDEYSLIKNSEGHHSIYEDSLPRVICSVIMSDGQSGITAKTMEEAENLLNQGYYVAGYGLLNPYSSDANNLEGFFESEDVVGLVRK